MSVVIAFRGRVTRDSILSKILHEMQVNDYNRVAGHTIELVYSFRKDPTIVQPVTQTLHYLAAANRPFHIMTIATHTAKVAVAESELMKTSVSCLLETADTGIKNDARRTLSYLSEGVINTIHDLEARNKLSEKLCALALAADNINLQYTAECLLYTMKGMLHGPKVLTEEFQSLMDEGVFYCYEDIVPTIYADVLETLADRLAQHDQAQTFDSYAALLFGFPGDEERVKTLLDKSIKLLETTEQAGNVTLVSETAGILLDLPVTDSTLNIRLQEMQARNEELSNVPLPCKEALPVTLEAFMNACPAGPTLR